LADHLFTTREWALGSGAGSDDEWAPVAASLGVDLDHLVRLRQVHGAAVVVRRAGDRLPSGPRPEADIVVSNDPLVAIAIQTADCVPLLLADSRSGAVAAAHAGWRGLAASVPAAAVSALAHAFDARPKDLVAAVGRLLPRPPTRSAPMSPNDSLPRALAAIGWRAGSAMASARVAGSSTDGRRRPISSPRRVFRRARSTAPACARRPIPTSFVLIAATK
jgi:hypothetical protein